MKKIAIEDMKCRSAVISYLSAGYKSKKESSHKIRRVKTVPEKRYEKIYVKENGQLKSDEEIFKEFVNSDKEIDFEKTGCQIKHLKQFYEDKYGDAARNVWFEETIYDKDGNIKDVHELVEKQNNICNAENPLRWTGKYIPYEEAAKKFVIKQVYRLCHVDGLTFDFLFDISKDLEEKQSVMYMGAGPDGNDPAVFRQGGKPYRVFLKGKAGVSNDVKGQRRYYQLLLLLCEMEYSSELKCGSDL